MSMVPVNNFFLMIKNILSFLKIGEVLNEIKNGLFEKSGVKEWWLNGKRHREDGPAVEYSNGHKYWYLNGKLHRDDGPAVEYSNGTKEWYKNGKQHREDGPAIEYSNGHKYWYLNNKELSKEEFQTYQKKSLNKLEINFE